MGQLMHGYSMEWNLFKPAEMDDFLLNNEKKTFNKYDGMEKMKKHSYLK